VSGHAGDAEISVGGLRGCIYINIFLGGYCKCYSVINVFCLGFRCSHVIQYEFGLISFLFILGSLVNQLIRSSSFLWWKGGFSCLLKILCEGTKNMSSEQHFKWKASEMNFKGYLDFLSISKSSITAFMIPSSVKTSHATMAMPFPARTADSYAWDVPAAFANAG